MLDGHVVDFTRYGEVMVCIFMKSTSLKTLPSQLIQHTIQKSFTFITNMNVEDLLFAF